VKGMRTYDSKAPSTPNRGPDGTRTPSRSPATATREPETSPVRTHMVMPPVGTVKLQSGTRARSAAARSSRHSRARARRSARAWSQRPPRSSQATANWSTTGEARSR
jgi:hypothetical protein